MPCIEGPIKRLVTLALSVSASVTIVAPATATGTVTGQTPDGKTHANSLPYARPGAAHHALLREGSRLLRVTGRAQRDELHRTWTFTIDPDDTQTPRHELTLMPGSLLEEMEHMIEAATDHQLVFETTGDVFVHRQRNYLMLSQPALLIGHESGPAKIDPTEGPPESPPGGTGISTEEIIRDLERSVGRIPRRWSGEPRTESDVIGDALKPVLEGTVLLSRRGVIRRTKAGGFMFIFDADAEGLADPPMTLLPCLLLERLERYSQENTEDAGVLLTGYVYTHRGKNFLLPTVYRIPHERTQITP